MLQAIKRGRRQRLGAGAVVWWLTLVAAAGPSDQRLVLMGIEKLEAQDYARATELLVKATQNSAPPPRKHTGF